MKTLEGLACPCTVIGFEGVGTEIPIDAGPDDVLSPEESFTHTFDIKLTTQAKFKFFVDVFGQQ